MDRMDILFAVLIEYVLGFVDMSCLCCFWEFLKRSLGVKASKDLYCMSH